MSLVENRCPHPTTTTRRIPMEIWDTSSKPGNRIPEALWHTCTLCGASFYLQEVFHKIGYPVPPPEKEPLIYFDASND